MLLPALLFLLGLSRARRPCFEAVHRREHQPRPAGPRLDVLEDRTSQVFSERGRKSCRRHVLIIPGVVCHRLLSNNPQLAKQVPCSVHATANSGVLPFGSPFVGLAESGLSAYCLELEGGPQRKTDHQRELLRLVLSTGPRLSDAGT